MQHTKGGGGGGSRLSFHRGLPPPLTQAEKWFEFTDVRKKGAITCMEVSNSMLLHIRPGSRYEERFIKGKIEDSWRNFSSPCGTRVTKEAFMSKRMNRFLMSVEQQFNQKFNSDRSQSESSRDLFQGVNSHSTGQLTNGANGSSSRRDQMQNSRRSGSFFGLGSKAKSCKDIGSKKKSIPSLSDNPKGWFSHFDVVDRGALNKTQVVNALIATFNANSEKEQNAIRANVGRIWSNFVSKQDGTITKFEFLLADGLADKLKSMKLTVPPGPSIFGNTAASGASSQVASALDPPPLSTRGTWFDYFDRDRHGHLTQNQVIHGLIVTFRANEVVQQNNIRHFIQSLWPSYIGDANTCVSRDGFIIGFADVLIQNSSTFKSSTPADASQSDGIEIRVNIPQGMEPGKRIKVQSPRSSDMVVLSIPEQSRWGGGSNGEPYFFTVVL